MDKSKYMNPAQMLSDSLSSIHTNKMGIMPRAGLDKKEKEQIESEGQELFAEIRDGNLDFVTDALAAHIIILNNIVAVCHRKAGGDYFREYTALSVKAADQLRKSGLALAQIKNVIIHIDKFIIQNNLLQIEESQKESKRISCGKRVVEAEQIETERACIPS